MAKSRRKAREAALRALYEIELGHSRPEDATLAAVDAMNLSPDLGEYALKIVRGVRSRLYQLDGLITPLLKDYDYTRLAAVDRNVIRIGAYELLEEPAIPPAVTLNEAIEIAKKYSTAESGKFVNGVLGRLLKDTPKAIWDPADAPVEFEPEEEDFLDEPEPIVEETVDEDSSEAKTARRYGWILRAEEASVPNS